jgi:hypothetical protein
MRIEYKFDRRAFGKRLEKERQLARLREQI